MFYKPLWLQVQELKQDLRQILAETRHLHPYQKTKYKRVNEIPKDNKLIYKLPLQ